MPRRMRTNHPEYEQDADLCSLSLGARLLHRDLPKHMDKAGRIQDNARLIKAECFAMDDDITAPIVDGYLGQLASIHRLCRYVGADGKRYAHDPHWKKEQRPHIKEAESVIPPCPTHEHGVEHSVPHGVEHSAQNGARGEPLAVLDTVSDTGSSTTGILDRGSDSLVSGNLELREGDAGSLSAACITQFQEGYTAMRECPWTESISKKTSAELRAIINSRRDVDTFAERFGRIAIYMLREASFGGKWPLDQATFANLCRNFSAIEAKAVEAGVVPGLDRDGRVIVYEIPENWRQKCERLGHDPKCSTLGECLCFQETGARPPRSADVWDRAKAIAS